MILQGKYAVQCNNSIQYKMIKALYEGIGGKVNIVEKGNTLLINGHIMTAGSRSEYQDYETYNADELIKKFYLLLPALQLDDLQKLKPRWANAVTITTYGVIWLAEHPSVFEPQGYICKGTAPKIKAEFQSYRVDKKLHGFTLPLSTCNEEKFKEGDKVLVYGRNTIYEYKGQRDSKTAELKGPLGLFTINLDEITLASTSNLKIMKNLFPNLELTGA